MVRAGQSSERAALIYQHSDDERQQEVAAGLNDLIAVGAQEGRWEGRAERFWHGSGTRCLSRSGQQTTPGSLTWGFVVERATGIEPAL